MEKINDRLVQLEIDVLSANDKKAAQNREKFIAEGILALNLVSSPGSGKTTLLCNTINKIKDQYKLAVIEGDQQTLNDAERIRATGCRAIQINTGVIPQDKQEGVEVKQAIAELGMPKTIYASKSVKGQVDSISLSYSTTDNMTVSLYFDEVNGLYRLKSLLTSTV